MAGLDFARAYLDDLLIISRENLDEHLRSTGTGPDYVAEAGLKLNASKKLTL